MSRCYHNGQARLLLGCRGAARPVGPTASGDLMDDMAILIVGWELPSDETIKGAVHLHQASVELRDSPISGVCGDGPLFSLCSDLEQRFF